MPDLLKLTEAGLYCESGDFYVDPWRSVDRAVITHAHSDHARWGMGSYLCAAPGLAVMRSRLGPDSQIQTLEYGETITHNGVKLTLCPAGHILGSSQVRIEDNGEVWVVSGDYKSDPDPTCEPFVPIKCHTFITESTFGLPVYSWPSEREVFDQINRWWRTNQQAGRTSVLYGYSLGKAQRAIAGVDSSIGPIRVHGAIQRLNNGYRWAGVKLPPTELATIQDRGYKWSDALVVAPPSANGTPWLRRFGDISTGFASGWMAIRGIRRRNAMDRGFVLSDHCDWSGLLAAIEATGAERVLVTHGYTNILTRYLVEKGMNAQILPTRFVGESLEGEVTESTPVEQAQSKEDEA